MRNFSGVIALFSTAIGIIIADRCSDTPAMLVATSTLAADFSWFFRAIGVAAVFQQHVDVPLSWLVISLLLSLVLWGFASIIWRSVLIVAWFGFCRQQKL